MKDPYGGHCRVSRHSLFDEVRPKAELRGTAAEQPVRDPYDGHCRVSRRSLLGDSKQRSRDVLLQPSASYSFILRTETSNRPGTLGRVTTAIGEEGGDIGAIDIVRASGGKMVRDLTVAARDEAHAETIVQRVRGVDGVNVMHVTDRTFLVH